MRTVAFLLAFVLVAPLSGAEPGEALTTSDLVAVHEKVAEANKYLDNEFIFEETVADALNEAKEYKGRPVKLVVVVVRVTMDHVVVEAFPQPERRIVPADGTRTLNRSVLPQDGRRSSAQTGRGGSPQTVPQLVLLERYDLAEQVQNAAFEGAVGSTRPDNPMHATLDIDSVVPLELAKTLRNGDRLEVTGKLADVVKAAYVFAPMTKIAAAKFVIIDPAAQKATD